MGKSNSKWKLSIRDGEKHSLDWCKNNPKEAQKERERIKQELIKLNENSENKICLKEEYPALFNE